MKKHGMLAVTLGILSVSAICFAATTTISTNPVTITAVEVDHVADAGDGDPAALTSTFVAFAAQPNSRPLCANGSPPTGSESVVVGGSDNVRNTTALATSAMLAGKKVRVIYSLTAPICVSYGALTYAKIAGFRVEQ